MSLFDETSSEDEVAQLPKLIEVRDEATTPQPSGIHDVDKSFLEKIVEALRNSPADPEKGTSIVRIKAYLKEKYRIRKAEMGKMLKPAMENAMQRKIVIKTTGNGLLTGSVRLNSNYAVKKEHSHATLKQQGYLSDSALNQAVEVVTTRKRKATVDTDRPMKKRLVIQRLG
ncbi:uncharacterized protein LOC131685123 [Topomyia yanbarensis]|uniref:uncharacterized protein LOC131685123 n=1 Tax=Topomyia yanbarensis TaxID=2498891 RepID=UPI00273AF373|nr:uncharacterized protein LOC131685123 [Topomyia yanbarensis]